MKSCYCIGRVIEIREGYAAGGETRPHALVLTMEPNPATPTMKAEVIAAPDVARSLGGIGARVRLDFSSEPDAHGAQCTINQIAAWLPTSRKLTLVGVHHAGELMRVGQVEIGLASELADGADVGQVVHVGVRPATEAEWEAFSAAVRLYEPRAVPT